MVAGPPLKLMGVVKPPPTIFWGGSTTPNIF